MPYGRVLVYDEIVFGPPPCGMESTMPAIQPPPVPPASPPVPAVASAAVPGDSFAAVDAFVYTIYRTGFVQSLILHVVALLVLALIVVRPDLPRPDVIALDFTAAGSEPEPDAAPFDLPALEPEELVPPDDAEPLPLADLPEPEIEIELDEVEPAVFTVDAEVAQPEAAALLADVAVPAARRGPPAAAAAAPVAGGGGGAIGGEIGRRLTAAGAGTGDVQVSIAWNNVNDIDLHVLVEPLDPRFGASIINFTNRVGIGGGCLDVDRNVHPTTVTPVENVFWGKGMAPYGRFTVAVHHYRDWGGDDPTEVEVVVLVDGEEERFRVTLRPGDPVRRVTSFRRVPKPGMQAAAGSAALPAPRPAWRPVPAGGGWGPPPRMIPLKPPR
jgi:hypothetical protein